MAKKYYDTETYDHALRVASFVADNNLIPEHLKDTCIALAIMHDLLEDTEYEIGANSEHIFEALKIITREHEMSYLDYIRKIVLFREGCPEAYYVKLADIKDHLMQKETLTDSLKERYLSALAILL